MIQNPQSPPLQMNESAQNANYPPSVDQKGYSKNQADLPDHPSHIEEHLEHEDHIHKILLTGSIIVTIIATLCVACATYLGILYESDRSAAEVIAPKKLFHDGIFFLCFSLI